MTKKLTWPPLRFWYLYKAYQDILGKVSFDAKDISEDIFDEDDQDFHEVEAVAADAEDEVAGEVEDGDEDEVEVEEEVAAEGEDTVEVEVEEVEFEEV